MAIPDPHALARQIPSDLRETYLANREIDDEKYILAKLDKERDEGYARIFAGKHRLPSAPPETNQPPAPRADDEMKGKLFELPIEETERHDAYPDDDEEKGP